jgi:hypothetical protein
MMTINLAPLPRLGPVFDADAPGLLRFVPRRPWWPLLPVLVVSAPVIGVVLAVDRLTRREPAIV